MAKRVVDEEMRFTVIVNGDSAKKELYDLEKRNHSLTSANKEYRAEQAKLVSQGKKNSQEYKNLSAEISKNNKELKENKSRMKELQAQIGVTGLTMRQLQQRASQLRLQLLNMVPGSAKYKKLETDLKQVNGQITKLRLGAKASQSSLSKLANGFNKYAALGASIIATGTGIVLSLQQMIDFNGKLADAQSNVQKTTGLTKKETRELTKEFGLFKTRTARIELLKLAEEAGRLGIEGKANVLEFVKTANEIKLALGDDLSDAQIREVGKIAKIYKVGEQNNRSFAESFQSVGSAINEVSASGANQADYLVDFLKRTGGISDIANIAAQDMIGLAAAFDEAGQSQEISATAINKTFGSMAGNAEKFAKIAGVGVKEFSKILEEDANEALILFLEGLKKGNPGLEEMEARLDGIELGGTRGKQAISALAANIDNLRKKQELANQALLDNTSLTAEAKLREENLAAVLEKIQRRIRGIFASDEVVEGLTSFVEWFGKFIGAVEDGDGEVTRFRNNLVSFLKTVLVITVAILSYNTALKLTTLWTTNAWQATRLYALVQKISTASTYAQLVAIDLLNIAKLVLTGRLKAARVAMIAFNTATKLNPIGLLLGLLAAVVTAYALFSDASKKAATSQSLLNKAMAEADKNTAETIKNKQLLLDVARDENLSLKQRQDAIDELNRTVPEYNNQLTIATVQLEENTKKLDRHIESLKQSAVAYVLQERIKKKAVELADLENSALKDNIEWYEELWNGIKSGGQHFATQARNAQTAINNKRESIAATKEEIAVLEELYKAQLKSNPSLSVTDENGSPEEKKKKFFTSNKTSSSSSGKSKIDQAKKEAAALLKLERETEDARIALIEDAFAREIAMNNAMFTRKQQDLEREFEANQEAYDKAILAGDTNLASILQAKNEELIKQWDQQEQLKLDKQNDILQKGIENHINKLQEQYNREAQERQTAHNNELAALGNNDKAKKALQKAFDKEELDLQKTHQEALIKELNDVLENAKFEDFDIDILSEEQKQAVVDRLSALGLKLSEINALLAYMKGEKKEQHELDQAALGEMGISGNVDILGMTPEQWEATFTNIDSLATAFGAVANILGAAKEAYALYDKYITASENKKMRRLERNFNREKASLQKSLDNQFISKKQYETGVDKLQKEFDKKKADLEYKQAKRKWQGDKLSAIANVALGVTQALASSPPPANFILAGIVGLMGALQIATVAKNKPVKGYQTGFYGNLFPVQREQDGKHFNAEFGGESRSGLVDKPTVFLAGEQGKNFPELIINGPDLKKFNPDLKSSLYREIRRVRGYQDGVYDGVKQDSNSTDSSNNEASALMMILLKENIEVLKSLKEEGVVAYLNKDFETIEKLQKEFDRLDKIKRKSIISS